MPALDPDPRRRYSTVEELGHALETAHFRTALVGEEEGVLAVDEASVDADVSGGSESAEDGLETEPHIILEQTASGRFQAVRAAKEYRAPSLAPTADPTLTDGRAGGEEEAPASGGVARFWRSAVDDSKPELAGKVAEFKARARSRAKRASLGPGRGGEVPREHRSPVPQRVPWEPRARQRFGVVLFSSLLVVECALGLHLWLGQATDLWATEAQNENLVEEIEEQKLLAAEVADLMDEDKRIRAALTFLSVAERRRRLPALALDQIEVSKPVGLLWIDSLEIQEDTFVVEAFIHSESQADDLFMERLEAEPLLSAVKLESRKRSGRTDGSYDRVRVEGSLGLPGPRPIQRKGR
jgi:Tfp pilus assembly protein PilN